MGNDNYYFFTNNISESFNKAINSKFIKSKRNFYNFEKCIKEILDFYSNKEDYKEKNFSITRALFWYISYNNIEDLINIDEYKNIIKKYIEFMKNKNRNNEEYKIDNLSDINIENVEYNINDNEDDFFSSEISDTSPDDL